MSGIVSSKKSLVIILAVALAVICGLLVYGILVTPARQPYRDAQAQFKHVDSSLARTNISLNASEASEEEFAKSVEAVRAAVASLEKENEALGKQQVLTEGEGKTLYDAYDKDLEKFAAYNMNTLDSMQKIQPVLRKCSAEMQSAKADAQGAAVVRACATEMQAASDVPDADYKQLAESFAENYTALAGILEQMAAISDTKSAEYATLGEQRDAVLENFSTASSTFTKNVQQHRSAVLATNSAKALHDYLEAKSRVF